MYTAHQSYRHWTECHWEYIYNKLMDEWYIEFIAKSEEISNT